MIAELRQQSKLQSLAYRRYLSRNRLLIRSYLFYLAYQIAPIINKVPLRTGRIERFSYPTILHRSLGVSTKLNTFEMEKLCKVEIYRHGYIKQLFATACPPHAKAKP